MSKKIVIVGEAWSEQDQVTGKPFSGPAGGMLHSMLRSCGIESKECFFTNVFNFYTPGRGVEALCGSKQEAIPESQPLFPGKFVRAEYASELQRLYREIEIENPNLIIALGNTALWALSERAGIKKYRGTPMRGRTDHKLLATWSPTDVFKMYKLYPIVLSDLTKAAREAEFPELLRPKREIWIEPSLEDIEKFYRLHIWPSAGLISCDIETKERTITEIGFAPTPYIAIVIPFFCRRATDKNYWKTLEEEIAAWSWVRLILQRACFGQNFQYDTKYLLEKMGILPKRWEEDTMLIHHSLQPEMEKGLGFMATLYTDEPSWKFMRTEHDTIKKED